MKTRKPNIYDYNDFRKYLFDFHKSRKEQDKTFTRSEFSIQLGLPNTRSFINDVIKGKKVTTTFIDRFARVLSLDKNEAQFFRTLVKFNQAENLDERELYFDQLISLNQTPKKVLDSKVYTYYKHWYNSVIRALLNIIDFNDDYRMLSKIVIPNITKKQAEESIKLLQELELIKQDENGFLKPVNKVLSASDSVKNELLKQYQLKCIDNSKNTFFTSHNKSQRVITKTISISEEGYKRLDNKLTQISSQINSLIHKDEQKADRVYQLSFLLTPQSK